MTVRTVILKYETSRIDMTDNDGQHVIVVFGEDNATIQSKLHGDDEYVTGYISNEDAEINALFLLGIPNER